MRWVSAFLVCVATPLFVLAAIAVLPVAWLAAAGGLFIALGTGAVLVSRRQPNAAAPSAEATKPAAEP